MNGPDQLRVRAVAPLRQSGRGGSGSFLVRADDGHRYWCKTLNNMQDPRVPINEYVVARLGWFLDVGVCEPRLVEIPAALVGWEFRSGRFLEEGWAYGGLAVEGAIETHELEHRSTDDNSVRHTGFFALHDWLGGQDPQWLYAAGDENRYYSHDHGHYFWGPAWTAPTLAANAGTGAQLAKPSTGLDGDEVERLATKLEGAGREEIASLLTNLPSSWPIDETEVDALVDFVVQRRSPVAQRLRAMPV